MNNNNLEEPVKIMDQKLQSSPHPATRTALTVGLVTLPLLVAGIVSCYYLTERINDIELKQITELQLRISNIELLLRGKNLQRQRRDVYQYRGPDIRGAKGDNSHINDKGDNPIDDFSDELSGYHSDNTFEGYGNGFGNGQGYDEHGEMAGRNGIKNGLNNKGKGDAGNMNGNDNSNSGNNGNSSGNRNKGQGQNGNGNGNSNTALQKGDMGYQYHGLPTTPHSEMSAQPYQHTPSAYPAIPTRQSYTHRTAQHGSNDRNNNNNYDNNDNNNNNSREHHQSNQHPVDRNYVAPSRRPYTRPTATTHSGYGKTTTSAPYMTSAPVTSYTRRPTRKPYAQQHTTRTEYTRYSTRTPNMRSPTRTPYTRPATRTPYAQQPATRTRYTKQPTTRSWYARPTTRIPYTSSTRRMMYPRPRPTSTPYTRTTTTYYQNHGNPNTRGDALNHDRYNPHQSYGPSGYDRQSRPYHTRPDNNPHHKTVGEEEYGYTGPDLSELDRFLDQLDDDIDRRGTREPRCWCRENEHGAQGDRGYPGISGEKGRERYGAKGEHGYPAQSETHGAVGADGYPGNKGADRARDMSYHQHHY